MGYTFSSRRILPSVCALLISAGILNLHETQAKDEDRKVMYFGFFFDEVIAKSIQNASETYFNVSQSGFTNLDEFLKHVSENSGINNPLNYFSKPLDPNTGEEDPLYHVTAKFCGLNETKQEECAEYEKKFEKHINQTFQIELVGYVLTNRTFGVRINLVGDQLELFENQSEAAEESASAFSSSSPGSPSPPIYDGFIIEEVDPFPPPLPVVNLTAHSTLGCSPGIPAVTTGPDMLQAIGLEGEIPPNVEVTQFDDVVDPLSAEAKTMRITEFKYTNANLTDNVYIIYPRVRILANATFRQYYYKSGAETLKSVGGVGAALFFVLRKLYLHSIF